MASVAPGEDGYTSSFNERLKTRLGQNKEEEPMELDKKGKLKEFLDSKEKKRQEEFELDKSEDLSCPDCRSTIYKSENKNIKLCVCYGPHMHKEIKIKKGENGRVSLKFPKSFDIENVEMLLDTLKRK
jgi:ribosomal protein L37AE/L43A